MAENKAHHFVPQFYLKRFGNGRQIGLYHLQTGRFIDGASIRKQCQRSYLYGSDLKLEKELAALEGHASAAIRKAADAESAPEYGSDEYDALVAFVSTLWFRTPAATAEFESVASAMMRATLRLDPTVPDDIKAALDEVRMVPKDPAAPLRFAHQMAPMMLDLGLVVVVNESPIEFVTSDAPVVLYNQWNSRSRESGSTGFASQGLQIFLPIDPRHLLLFYDSGVYAVGGKKGARVAFSDSRTADAVNRLQLTVAQHSLFHSGAPGVRDAIAGLPRNKHASRSEVAQTNVAIGVSNPNSVLIHLYAQRPKLARLDFSFSRVRRAAKRVPQRARWNQYRPEALALDEAINGPRPDRVQQPSETRWRIPTEQRPRRR